MDGGEFFSCALGRGRGRGRGENWVLVKEVKSTLGLLPSSTPSWWGCERSWHNNRFLSVKCKQCTGVLLVGYFKCVAFCRRVAKTKKKYIHIKKKKKKRYQTKYFKGTEMAQWWEHPPPTALAWVRPSDLTSLVDHAHPWGFFRFSFIHKINVLNSTRTFTQTQILLTKLHIDWLFITFHFLHLDSHLRIRRRRTI